MAFFRPLEPLVQDLRSAWRGMRRSPSFVATTVLTLAVGLGFPTIAFTIFNAYVLRPFAVRDPGSLHLIAWRARDGGGMQFRWRDYQALAGRSDLFGGSIAEHGRFISSNGRPLLAALVSPNYFEMLGPAIHAGRGLGAIDDAGTHNAVVLSHLAWLRTFEGDPSAVGRTIDLNGRAFTIVGVTAPAFSGLGDERPDLWVPLATYAEIDSPDLIAGEQTRAVQVYVRLRPGVTAGQAEAALGPLMQQIVEDGELVRAEIRTHASPNALSLTMLMVLSPVFAAFALVLATSCANVSNMMLARAVARHREIVIRLSVGASRGRLVRQLLTEGLLLAVLAGLAGLGLASGGLRAATALIAGTLPPSVAGIIRLAPLTFDYRVFLFALAAAAAATLLFALLPALQASRVTLTDALRGHGGAAWRGSRLRDTLVIAQVAVSIVLVILAVTLARNGAAIGAIDPGFDTGGVISVNVRGARQDLVRPVALALADDSRVADVAVTSGNPLFVTRWIAAAPAGGSTVVRTPYTFASPGFFSLLRIPIARGRGFRDDEARTAAKVAIVSVATADALWPGQDPVGQTVRIEPPDGRSVSDLPGYSEVTVVGVVRDIVSGMLFAGPDTGHIYLPISPVDSHATAIMVRGRTDRDPGPEALQEIFKRAVPDTQVLEAIPLAELRDLQIYPLLAASWVGSLLGAVALVLSVSGLYGVLTYMLNQRTSEIGIRMALGATAGAVVRLVLRQSTRLAGFGAVAGGVVAFAAMQALGAAITLKAISFVDLTAFAAGVALVIAATALAAYRPARRAARIDPASTLRAD